MPLGADSMAFVPSNETIICYGALKDLYLEFDQENQQVGFAARSNNACDGSCSEILAEQTCTFTKGCSWENSKCVGGMFGSGSKSRGSFVVPADECFPFTARARPTSNLRGASPSSHQ